MDRTAGKGNKQCETGAATCDKKGLDNDLPGIGLRGNS
jgi:hypothetical protein